MRSRLVSVTLNEWEILWMFGFKNNFNGKVYSYACWNNSNGWELRWWDWSVDQGNGYFGSWVLETEQEYIDSFPDDWKRRMEEGRHLDYSFFDPNWEKPE